MGKFITFLKEDQEQQTEPIQAILNNGPIYTTLFLSYINDGVIESTFQIPSDFINQIDKHVRVTIFRTLVRNQFPIDVRFIEYPELSDNINDLTNVLTVLVNRNLQIPKFVESLIPNLEYTEILFIVRQFIEIGISVPEAVQDWLLKQSDSNMSKYLKAFVIDYIRITDQSSNFYLKFPTKWIKMIGTLKDKAVGSEILDLMDAADIPLNAEYLGEINISSTPQQALKQYKNDNKSQEILNSLSKSAKHSKDAVLFDLLEKKTFTVFPILLGAIRSDQPVYDKFIEGVSYRYFFESGIEKDSIFTLLEDEIINHFVKNDTTGYNTYQALSNCYTYKIPLMEKILANTPKTIINNYIPMIITLLIETGDIDLFPDNIFDTIKTPNNAYEVAITYIHQHYPLPDKLLKVYLGLLKTQQKASQTESDSHNLAESELMYLLSWMLQKMSSYPKDPKYQPEEFLNQNILNDLAGFLHSSEYIVDIIERITAYNNKPGPIGLLRVPDSVMVNLEKHPVEYLAFRLNSGDENYTLEEVEPFMTNPYEGGDTYSKYFVFDKFSLSDIKKYESKMTKSFKKYYFYPRIKAEKYNRYYDGIFIHATGNIQNTLSLYKDTNKNPAEICVSTIRTDSVFRSPDTSNRNALLIGYGDIRLLFDFDAFTARDETGRRYATSSFEEGEEEPTDFHKNIPEKWKKFGEKMSRYVDYNPELHMDEGIMNLKTCELLLVVADSQHTKNEIRKFLKKQDVQIISFERYKKIHSSENLIHFLETLKNHQNDRHIHGHPFHKYEEMVKTTPFTNFLLTEGKVDLDMDRAYNLFSAEYIAATGRTWSRNKFMQRASNWNFYGDEDGFVAIRNQKSGFVKLVGMAGSNKSKYKGFKELITMGVPLWGMVSKDIAQMAIKMGMRFPNWLERSVLKKMINPSVLGGAKILGYTNDGGVEFEYPDMGKVTKYCIGTPAYYKKAAIMFKDIAIKKIGF